MCEEVVEYYQSCVVLGDGPYPGDNRRVAPGNGGEMLIFEGVFVDCPLRFGDCGRGLDGQPDDNWLAGREAARNPACII